MKKRKFSIPDDATLDKILEMASEKLRPEFFKDIKIKIDYSGCYYEHDRPDIVMEIPEYILNYKK